MADLKELSSDSPVFVDTNIFTYFLLKDPLYFERCRNFITRIESGEIPAFINSLVVTETIFNFVKGEIIKKLRVKPHKFMTFIKKNPREIGKVDISPAITLLSIPSLVLIDPSKDYLMANLSQSHRQNLLSSDAYHFLTMQYIGIHNIATNDVDFGRVKGIKIWKP